DTGSARTILSADALAVLGIGPEPNDVLRTMRGVGGSETVFTRRLDRVTVDGRGVDAFEGPVGGGDYGFLITGILGMDFLVETQATIDLHALTIEFAPA